MTPTRSPDDSDPPLPALRSRLPTLRVCLLALGLFAAVVGAGVTGSGVVALSTDSPSSASETGASGAITADALTGDGPTDRSEITGGFVRPVYTGVAGDPVEIRHTDEGGTRTCSSAGTASPTPDSRSGSSMSSG